MTKKMVMTIMLALMTVTLTNKVTPTLHTSTISNQLLVHSFKRLKMTHFLKCSVPRHQQIEYTLNEHMNHIRQS